MEILIVGVIIVALMVYASTKIKRLSASAFEQEAIETEDFSFIKPEGFLHVVGNESEFEFYAYSKEFGNSGAEEMRQAEIFIKKFTGKNLKSICNGIKSQNERIIHEEFSDDGKECLIEAEKTVRGIVINEYFKIFEKEKIFQIKISVLKNLSDSYGSKIETVFDSFRVK